MAAASSERGAPRLSEQLALSGSLTSGDEATYYVPPVTGQSLLPHPQIRLLGSHSVLHHHCTVLSRWSAVGGPGVTSTDPPTSRPGSASPKVSNPIGSPGKTMPEPVAVLSEFLHHSRKAQTPPKAKKRERLRHLVRLLGAPNFAVRYPSAAVLQLRATFVAQCSQVATKFGVRVANIHRQIHELLLPLRQITYFDRLGGSAAESAPGGVGGLPSPVSSASDCWRALLDDATPDDCVMDIPSQSGKMISVRKIILHIIRQIWQPAPSREGGAHPSLHSSRRCPQTSAVGGAKSERWPVPSAGSHVNSSPIQEPLTARSVTFKPPDGKIGEADGTTNPSASSRPRSGSPTAELRFRRRHQNEEDSLFHALTTTAYATDIVKDLVWYFYLEFFALADLDERFDTYRMALLDRIIQEEQLAVQFSRKKKILRRLSHLSSVDGIGSADPDDDLSSSDEDSAGSRDASTSRAASMVSRKNSQSGMMSCSIPAGSLASLSASTGGAAQPNVAAQLGGGADRLVSSVSMSESTMSLASSHLAAKSVEPTRPIEATKPPQEACGGVVDLLRLLAWKSAYSTGPQRVVPSPKGPEDQSGEYAQLIDRDVLHVYLPSALGAAGCDSVTLQEHASSGSTANDMAMLRRRVLYVGFRMEPSLILAGEINSLRALDTIAYIEGRRKELTYSGANNESGKNVMRQLPKFQQPQLQPSQAGPSVGSTLTQAEMETILLDTDISERGLRSSIIAAHASRLVRYAQAKLFARISRNYAFLLLSLLQFAPSQQQQQQGDDAPLPGASDAPSASTPGKNLRGNPQALADSATESSSAREGGRKAERRQFNSSDPVSLVFTHAPDVWANAVATTLFLMLPFARDLFTSSMLQHIKKRVTYWVQGVENHDVRGWPLFSSGGEAVMDLNFWVGTNEANQELRGTAGETRSANRAQSPVRGLSTPAITPSVNPSRGRRPTHEHLPSGVAGGKRHVRASHRCEKGSGRQEVGVPGPPHKGLSRSRSDSSMSAHSPRCEKGAVKRHQQLHRARSPGIERSWSSTSSKGTDTAHSTRPPSVACGVSSRSATPGPTARVSFFSTCSSVSSAAESHSLADGEFYQTAHREILHAFDELLSHPMERPAAVPAFTGARRERFAASTRAAAKADRAPTSLELSGSGKLGSRGGLAEKPSSGAAAAVDHPSSGKLPALGAGTRARKSNNAATEKQLPASSHTAAAANAIGSASARNWNETGQRANAIVMHRTGQNAGLTAVLQSVVMNSTATGSPTNSPAMAIVSFLPTFTRAVVGGTGVGIPACHAQDGTLYAPSQAAKPAAMLERSLGGEALTFMEYVTDPCKWYSSEEHMPSVQRMAQGSEKLSTAKSMTRAAAASPSKRDAITTSRLGCVGPEERRVFFDLTRTSPLLEEFMRHEGISLPQRALRLSTSRSTADTMRWT